MSLEMAHKVIVLQKKIMSRSFLNSGTLIVKNTHITFTDSFSDHHPPWEPEQRFELGPVLQQADAALYELDPWNKLGRITRFFAVLSFGLSLPPTTPTSICEYTVCTCCTLGEKMGGGGGLCHLRWGWRGWIQIRRQSKKRGPLPKLYSLQGHAAS
jgi:hypothetical protein